MAETAANKVFIFSSTKVPGPAGRISASRKTVPPPQMAGIRPHFYASIARRASACPRRDWPRTCGGADGPEIRSEEHTSELQSLMRISYAVFCLKKKKKHNNPLRAQ